MLDSVLFADGSGHRRESIGGPATFAYAGVKLFTDDVLQCSRLGIDYHELFDPWVKQNHIETRGYHVVSEHCNHSRLVYNPDGTYGSQDFQNVTITGEWVQNLGYMKTSPEDFDRFTDNDTRGIYIAQNCDSVFWDTLGEIKRRKHFKIMWEIEGPSAKFEFLDKVRYACQYVDCFSINIQEAQSLFNVKGDEACIKEIQKLPVDMSILRIGEHGLYSITKDCSWLIEPAPGPVVDPTGCGNCSTGGALYGFVEGYDPIKVGVIANVASGQNIRQFGVVQNFAGVRKESFKQVDDLYELYTKKYNLRGGKLYGQTI